jgi:2-keto-4-pentenoate hydratase/2-oxohepta-3-ene-1,7-dioic acid hydratase in catechol pathway
MRWIRYSLGGRTSYGIVEGDRIAEVRGGLFDTPPGMPPDRIGQTHALADVTIEIPLMPRTFYAAGLNYTEHVIEGAKKRGETPVIPQKPDMGYRAVNALIAHDQAVVIPADATKVQYEGEIVVVIGKTAKHLTEANALSCVFGYTIGNDVSERNWQKSDRTFWRSKNTDTFKPMGPWIETDVDLDAMETIVRLNGVETLRFHTNHMLFGIARFIATMTRYITLHPGDVIWMGTDGMSPDLVPGDVVEIELTGIGTLRNPFVLEGPL